MESVYDPKGFRASEPFPTKEYFQKFAEVCPLSVVSQDESDFKQQLIEDMGIPEDQYDFDILEESCSIDLLQLLDEPQNAIKNVPIQVTAKTKLDVSYPITESAKHLRVVKCKLIVEDRTNMKMITNKRFLKSTLIPQQSTYSNAQDLIPGKNFIYTIFVYSPFAIAYGQRNSSEKMRFSMEIEALGTNTLADVVDTVQCISNMGLFKEVENTKIEFTDLCNAKEQYPSQTVFINGVFYNDFRSDKAIDYSKGIIEWAKKHNIGKFTTAEMDKTTLDTLTPRFGYPYVFIHHGNCEHVISFADARLIQSGDLLTAKEYPRISSVTRNLTPLCALCNRAHSKWVVKDCNKFPHDKVFLCTYCCDSYLYIDGEKNGKFKLYPFYDMNCDGGR